MFRIELALLDKVLKFDEAKAGSLYSVAETLKNPARAFLGLSREDQDEGIAMLGRLRIRYHGTDPNHFRQAEPGMGFFVYTSKSLLIHDWGWIDFKKAKEDKHLSPKESEDLYCLRTFEFELKKPQEKQP